MPVKSSTRPIKNEPKPYTYPGLYWCKFSGEVIFFEKEGAGLVVGYMPHVHNPKSLGAAYQNATMSGYIPFVGEIVLTSEGN